MITLMQKLKDCFITAEELNQKYVGILVTVPGCPKPELIVNSVENVNGKLEYYKKAYTDNLHLKTFDQIRILSFAFGNCIDDIYRFCSNRVNYFQQEV